MTERSRASLTKWMRKSVIWRQLLTIAGDGVREREREHYIQITWQFEMRLTTDYVIVKSVPLNGRVYMRKRGKKEHQNFCPNGKTLVKKCDKTVILMNWPRPYMVVCFFFWFKCVLNTTQWMLIISNKSPFGTHQMISSWALGDANERSRARTRERVLTGTASMASSS